MSENNKWYHDVCAGLAIAISAPVALVAGTVAGVVKAAEDKSWDNFGTAFEETGSQVIEGAEELGRDYGPQVVAGVASVVVGGTLNSAISNGKKR